MIKDKYILGLDQGTISSKAAVYNSSGDLIGKKQILFNQIYPDSGWVEHDPEELWQSLYDAAVGALDDAKIETSQILALGVASQRETIVLWERKTGKPVYNAIVWQCRRSASICKEYISKGCANIVKEKTGLLLDPMFSATKLVWLFRRFPTLLERAKNGELCFGTVDSWIIYKLTGNHFTDPSCAGLTMLFNIHTEMWDKDLLEMFDIPQNILPEVKHTTDDFGLTKKEIFGIEIPVRACCGDQSAALFGHVCFTYGSLKTTYGSGCFSLANTGTTVIDSKNSLISVIAWDLGCGYTYALEGSVFGAGSAVQWLREEMRLVVNAPESERLARKVPNSGGVVMVPSFSGMGAPYWDPNARASIFGISSGTSKCHFVRAAIESIAFQNRDVIVAIEKDLGVRVPFVKVDGGSCDNSLLMQFQADLLDKPILLPENRDIISRGVAFFAGLYEGLWSDKRELEHIWSRKKDYTSTMDEQKRKSLITQWNKAVEATRLFAK